jgi:hypothetical protein
MRLRILVSVLAFGAVAAAGTIAARGAVAGTASNVCCVERHACCSGTESCCAATHAATQTSAHEQWSIVNFADTVVVNRKFVVGPVLIVHDDEKMARGEPCTTFYRLDPAEGPKEALVSFHCTPRRAKRVDATTFTTADSGVGVKRIVEYQLAGDDEAHGVPK